MGKECDGERRGGGKRREEEFIRGSQEGLGVCLESINELVRRESRQEERVCGVGCTALRSLGGSPASFRS